MRVLLTSNSFYNTPGEHHKALFEKRSITVDYKSGPLQESELLDIISKYDAVICGDDEYTERVLIKGASSNLKVLSKYGIGLDKIDVSKAHELNIPVFNTPGVNHESVAEHVLALILSYEKNIPAHWSNVASGNWHRIHGHELYSKSALIIGFGRIGQEVAKRFLAFGMSVSYYDPFVPGSRTFDVDKVESFDNLDSRFDYVSLNVPLNDETRGILASNVLGSLNDGAVVINTSRAGCVDYKALRKELISGKVRAYLTDVIEAEPMLDKHEWFDLDNVFVTPHVGSRNIETVQRQGLAAVQNLFNYLKI